MCLGFLPHNFNPAKIFMGDSGSMLLGLVVAAAAIVVTGQIDPAAVSTGQVLPAYVPILLPVAVLLLPLLDMTLAVLRRVRAGHSPFHPDRMHLHHRLLGLGHSHRRAVLIMYLWTTVFAFSAVALAVFSPLQVAVGAAVAIAVAAVVTYNQLPGLRHAGEPDDGAPAPHAPVGADAAAVSRSQGAIADSAPTRRRRRAGRRLRPARPALSRRHGPCRRPPRRARHHRPSPR